MMNIYWITVYNIFSHPDLAYFSNVFVCFLTIEGLLHSRVESHIGASLSFCLKCWSFEVLLEPNPQPAWITYIISKSIVPAFIVLC